MLKPHRISQVWGVCFALCGFALSSASPRQARNWQGSIVHEGGVTVVKNPKQPVCPEGTIILENDLSIGKGIGKDGYVFSQLAYVAVDDEETIYTMDQRDIQISVFDKTGKYLRTIGRKGQGPGEFQNPDEIFVTNRRELVVEDFIRNLSCFALDGKFLRALPTAALFPIGVLLDASGRVYAERNIPDREKPGKKIDLYDENLKFIMTVAIIREPKPDPSLLAPFHPQIEWAAATDGGLIIWRGGEYELDVFDAQGKIVRKIVKDYDPVGITSEDVKQRVRRVPEGRKLVIPKSFPPLQSLIADDEGRILAVTYEKSAEGAQISDVFDTAGRFLARVAFKGRPQAWRKNKLYTIEDDAEGYQVLKRYRVIWNIKQQ